MPSSRYIKADAWLGHPRLQALSHDAHTFLWRLVLAANDYNFVKYDDKLLHVMYESKNERSYLGKTESERKEKVKSILKELSSFHPEGSLILISRQHIPLRRKILSPYPVPIIFVQIMPVIAVDKTARLKRQFMMPLESQIIGGNLPGALAPGEESAFASNTVESRTPSEMRFDADMQETPEEETDSDPFLDEEESEFAAELDIRFPEDERASDEPLPIDFDEIEIEMEENLPAIEEKIEQAPYDPNAERISQFIEAEATLDTHMDDLIRQLKIQTGQDFEKASVQQVLTANKAEARKVALYLELGMDVNLASGMNIWEKLGSVARGAMR